MHKLINKVAHKFGLCLNRFVILNKRLPLHGKKGFGIIEVVIFVTILGVALTALFNAGIISLNIVSETHTKTQAAFLLEEGMEAIRHQRDESWDSLPFVVAGWENPERCLFFDQANQVYDMSYLPE